MRVAAIFVAFFLLFTLASLAVPVPMFPGNMIPVWFRIPPSTYDPYIEALMNGVVYGFITWLVFFLVSRRMDKALAPNPKSKR